MSEAPGWLDELPLSPEGPPWLSMGLSRVDESHWLLAGPPVERAAELAERRRLLEEHHAEVFDALPGTEPAGAEALALVQGWLTHHGPTAAPGPDRATGPPAGMHPLEQAGRLVQEDLCLMVPRDGAVHLDAACLCFPSHWRLADKLGRPAAAVHGPVPRYRDDLEARVDRYLDRLRPDVIGVRRNWSVHDSPALFAPDPPRSPVPVLPSEVGTRLWLRSERQTLRRLPVTGAVLFTIRVQQVSFEMLSTRPDVATRLAARLRVQPPELTAMNGLTTHLGPVLTWLDGQAQG